MNGSARHTAGASHVSGHSRLRIGKGENFLKLVATKLMVSLGRWSRDRFCPYFVGWLASLVMKTDGQQGILLNVVVGIVGAFIGGWLISPLVGAGTINDGFSIASLLVSLVGAIILLAIVNLFRRGRVR